MIEVLDGGLFIAFHDRLNMWRDTLQVEIKEGPDEGWGTIEERINYIFSRIAAEADELERNVLATVGHK